MAQRSRQRPFPNSGWEWLVDDEGGQKQVPVEGVSAILVPVSAVEMVEFLRGGPGEGLEE